MLPKKISRLLKRHDLNRYGVGMLLYSVRRGRYLYQRNIRHPFIAASNVKLLTTYSALKVLSPDYRFRTRFYQVRTADPETGQERMGLLVQGAGDPTLTLQELERVAIILRSYGLRHVDGGIYLNDNLYQDSGKPKNFGNRINGGESWLAPISPFIVEKNLVEFVISNPRGEPFEVYTRLPGLQVALRMKSGEQPNPKVSLEQQWGAGEARFTLSGSMRPSREPYFFSAAVEQPLRYFHILLRESLRKAGVTGEMPLMRPPKAYLEKRYLYTQASPPLRKVIMEVNKESNNLWAEVLLRTMGLKQKPRGLKAEDGLRVMRALVERELPGNKGQFTLRDGSGLNRNTRLSPLLLVRLLNRVYNDLNLRTEYLNSLSLSGLDGTMQYREYPHRVRGRIRAKTGTLSGVSNITGYMHVPGDVIIFAFLINGADRYFLELQKLQDRVLTGIYDHLTPRPVNKPTKSANPRVAGQSSKK